VLDWQIRGGSGFLDSDCSSVVLSHDLSSSRREPDWFLSVGLFLFDLVVRKDLGSSFNRFVVFIFTRLAFFGFSLWE
jgi:hypothetical protein